jgi:coniferyl-aldehyde dehydrogenase
MAALLERQRTTQLSEGPPPAEVRIDRIDRLIKAVVTNRDALVKALNADYGHRSSVQSTVSDVVGVLPTLKHTRAHVRAWMKPTKRSPGQLRMLGAKAWIEWQPLGVVGVISPWNFPVGLALHPTAQAFAAGNRVMLKLSEHVPATSGLMSQILGDAFDPAELAAVTGGPDVGNAFASLPFDHLFFTGSGPVGKHVLRGAADNLVPVTLELGGKCPVVVRPEADLSVVAQRVVAVKMLNAGQLCLSPDYLLVPAGMEDAMVAALREALARQYPRLVDNDDYTSVLGEHNHGRLTGLVSDAREKGAQVIELNPAGEDFADQPAHKFPPTLIVRADDSMAVMQDEIFGPVLPLEPYHGIDDAINRINSRDRPLAAYYFGADDEARRAFLQRTSSGGVTINDLVLHYLDEDLPFGGVGPSGMGSYKGRAGFETFSNAKGVVATPGRFSPYQLMSPPYGRLYRKLLDAQVRFEASAVGRRLRKRQR